MAGLSRHVRGIERVKWAVISLGLCVAASLIFAFWVPSESSLWICLAIGVAALLIVIQGLYQEKADRK